ncbi:cytochrome c biogenesis protein [Nocardioides terrae]|uniref:Cytochrome c biogenesis protein n=1 Tax=Nocardioides terrae TaxID=574651 RepID=A0A1I1HCW0_9ACTN|nr:cytochrome c biogenesis protein ResB [Nocardioides terrae]SFC21681.1 cytochrome c biogenesis protein [Nocardioides terrae]
MNNRTPQRSLTGPEGRVPQFSEGPEGPGQREEPTRRPGELTVRELLRWSWRQLTSMRTALILLLLLALAAVPGSLIPQSGVDSLKASQWQDAHTTLTPIYRKLGLFDVYSTPWFGAIYVLLMVSLVGCIVPRLRVYWRGLRAQPPAAPQQLLRLSDSASYTTEEEPEAVLARARAILRGKRYRIRRGADGDAVSAERGYLREAGNLVFHLSILFVLVGFAMGSLLGYKGGVIVVVGPDAGFTNTPSQYDDLDPGSLFKESRMDPFTFHINDFHVDWLNTGPKAGMAKGFRSQISYCQKTDCSDEKNYDLRVNHPLKIGSTEVFLIGHGYAPVITVRDGQGNVAYSGPTVFLPQDATFFSFGVVKAQAAKPEQIGLQGVFYPTFIMDDKGNPTTLMGNDLNPLISMHVYAGDLNPGGGPQSVYALDTSAAKEVMTPGDPKKALRLDMTPGQTVQLPDGLGSVTFDKVVRWNRVQISQTPGKLIALGGVVLCLIGLLGSLFIRPRRVWVRARRGEGGTLVEVATLDRSGGGDTAAVVRALTQALQEEKK